MRSVHSRPARRSRPGARCWASNRRARASAPPGPAPPAAASRSTARRAWRARNRADAPAPAVPGEGDSPRLPLGAALVPLAIGGSMAAITGNPALLSFALLTPAMALFSHVEGRRRRLAPARRRGGGLPARCRASWESSCGRPAWPRPRSAVPPAPMSRPSDAGPPRSIPACGSAVRAMPTSSSCAWGPADVLATARAELAPGGAQDLRDEALKACSPRRACPRCRSPWRWAAASSASPARTPRWPLSRACS